MIESVKINKIHQNLIANHLFDSFSLHIQQHRCMNRNLHNRCICHCFCMDYYCIRRYLFNKILDYFSRSILHYSLRKFSCISCTIISNDFSGFRNIIFLSGRSNVGYKMQKIACSDDDIEVAYNKTASDKCMQRG